MPLRAGCGGTAKPNGSKDLLNTFESTFGGTLGRLSQCVVREA
jgi:hypothetical protein